MSERTGRWYLGIFLGGIVTVVALVSVLTSAPAVVQPPVAVPPVAGSARLLVVTHIFALKWLAERIGGEHVDVRLLASGAHADSEITPADRVLLERADVIIYVGSSSLSLRERLGPSTDRISIVDVALLPGVAPLLDADPVLEDADLVEGKDPHVWLDPGDRMTSIASAVARVLVDVAGRDSRFQDGATNLSETFNDNADAVEQDLKRLDEELGTRLESCRGLSIVAEHPAFAYFAAEYQLQQLAVTKPLGGLLDPVEDERQHRLLRDVWNSERERTIFLDTPSSPEDIRSEEEEYIHGLANEFDAQYRYLESLEDTPQEDVTGSPRDYLDVMRDNMDAIREGLGCRELRALP